MSGDRTIRSRLITVLWKGPLSEWSTVWCTGSGCTPHRMRLRVQALCGSPIALRSSVRRMHFRELRVRIISHPTTAASECEMNSLNKNSWESCASATLSTETGKNLRLSTTM
ncbi:hypothetical protein AVEN_154947-1 [Araneus ventricosus]|uniref:Uncharacterized protein n=1 Tax=Araneus ventricosus TaxID=182803 RepID=A0A4Y2A724_ARAVE|nr:hypothetical protein AVEN_154947-1 [Araneus ventricosus]